MKQQNIRNFSIIAHIDHGKSTLADQLILTTGALSKREMKEQVLDSMDIEKERGITIQSAATQCTWEGHTINVIDTTGHVHLTNEV